MFTVTRERLNRSIRAGWESADQQEAGSNRPMLDPLP